MTARSVLVGLAAGLVACAGRPVRTATPDDPIVAWLCGAELQAETDAQREVLRGGLRDLSTLEPAALRARRYPDYEGTPGRWDLAQLLDRHFVPAPQALRPDGEAFWSACGSPELRAWAGRAAAAVDGWNTQRPAELCAAR